MTGLFGLFASIAVAGGVLGAFAALPASSRLLSDSLTPATRCRRVELLALHLPRVRASLRRCWRQAAEERADDAVAKQGHGLALASALLRWLRLDSGAAQPDQAVFAANAGNVSRRIRRLADDRREMRGSAWFGPLLGALALLTGTTLIAAHHAIETLVGWL